MNITNYTMMSQFRLMSQLLSRMTGKDVGLSMIEKTVGLSNSLDKMSWAYRNRYADVNEVKVNSQGLTGMTFNADTEDMATHHQIIGISDEGKQKIFNMVKHEFLHENGVANGEHRTEVYASYLRGIPEGDRARASWTLDRFESEYWMGFCTKAIQTNPAWQPGKPFDRKVLEGLTRKDVSGGPIDTQSNMGLDLRA